MAVFSSQDLTFDTFDSINSMENVLKYKVFKTKPLQMGTRPKVE